MLQILEIVGWLSVLGGAVLLFKGLLFHSRLEDAPRGWRTLKGGLSPKGKSLCMRGVLLVVLGHLLVDVVPSLIGQLRG